MRRLQLAVLEPVARSQPVDRQRRAGAVGVTARSTRPSPARSRSSQPSRPSVRRVDRVQARARVDPDTRPLGDDRGSGPMRVVLHLPDLEVPGDVGQRLRRPRRQRGDDARRIKRRIMSVPPLPREWTISATTVVDRLDGVGRPRRRPAATGRCPPRRRRLAPDDDDRPTAPPSPASMPSTTPGLIDVGVERRRDVVAGSAGSELGLDHGDGPRRLAASARRRRARARRSRRAARRRGARRGCRSPRPGRRRACGRVGSRLATSTPKPSSPRKMLPMPATSVLMAVDLGTSSTSSGWKYR